MRDLRDVLAEHHECTAVDTDVHRGADVDVWSCGLRTDYEPEIEEAGDRHNEAVVRAWATSDEAVAVVGKAVLDLGPDPTNLRIGFTATRALFGGDPRA